MPRNLAPQRWPMTLGDERLITISCDQLLDEGEVLSSTPPIEVQSPTGLDVSSVQPNPNPVTVLGRDIGVGRAVQMLARLQQINGDQECITCVVTAWSDRGQRLVRGFVVIGNFAPVVSPS